MDDRLAVRFFENNIMTRLQQAENRIALLEKLGIALQSYEDRVCSFDTKIGLVLSNNTTDANNDIDIAVGKIRDSADAANIEMTTAMTKRLDTSWTVGTNAGGLFSGSKAISTWYHVFVIMTSNGEIDAGFDTSVTAANKPAGYTYHRRIGSVRTDGSGNILEFYEYAGRFMWSASVTDLNGGTQTSATAFTVTVPLGLKVCVIGASYASAASGNRSLRVFDPDSDAGFAANYSTASNIQIGYQPIFSNASSQLKYYVVSGTAGYWYTYGWEELWQI